MKDITERYFDYLAERSNMASPFLLLARLMHKKQFYTLIDMDQNRVEDARKLRAEFLETVPDATEKDKEELDTPSCSVLELLLGLAIRLYSMYQDSEYEKPVGQWMGEMLGNLRLGYMTDSVMTNYPEYIHTANLVLDQFLERSYMDNGLFGLFPLKNPQQDQRTVEIWKQMMAYCLENYPMT